MDRPSKGRNESHRGFVPWKVKQRRGVTARVTGQGLHQDFRCLVTALIGPYTYPSAQTAVPLFGGRLGQILRVIGLPVCIPPVNINFEPWSQTNKTKFSFQLSPIGTIHKMNLMLCRDHISVIFLIVLFREFQRRSRGISYLIWVDVVVQSVGSDSPTPARTKPPLKSIGNVVRIFHREFHIPKVASLYAEYSEEKKAAHA
jgi:hypothetical protein